MNKFCKVVAALGGGILALGLVLVAAGLMMGGTYRQLNNIYDPGFRVGPFNFGGYYGWEGDDIPYWEESGSTEYTQTFQDVDSISVDCGMAQAYVVTGDGFQVEGRDLGRFVFQCDLVDGRLTVVCRPPNGFGGKRRNEKTPTITITLPKDFVADELIVEVGMGSLDAGRLHARRAELTVGMGELIVDDFSSGGGVLEVGMGVIDITGVLTGSHRVDCGMGTVQMALRGDADDYDYDVVVGMGDVTVGGNNGGGLGKSFSRSTGAPNDFSIDCSMGSVDIRIRE